MRVTVIAVIAFLLLNCHRPNGDDLFFPAQNLGKINEKLKEASGLVASISHPKMLWSLNDSGNDPEIFLVNETAHIELICRLDKIENRDWEDIAIGPGPKADVNYIYIADIGDNRADYPVKFIYRFPEPKEFGGKKQLISSFDTLILKLPGKNRDSETLMIDPQTKDLFIISKREDSVRLYQANYPFSKDTIKMAYKGKLPFSLIVAGTFSTDGNEILLKNYNKIFYWKRGVGETLPEILKREPKRLTYEPEHQGEAIAWARDNTGFFTLSESSVADRAQLRFYRRKNP